MSSSNAPERREASEAEQRGARETAEPQPYGIYVHFPYCASKCPYCDFAVSTERVIPGQRYTEALLAELRMRSPPFRKLRARTLFFGGGTPSLWDPAEVARVIETARRELALPSDAEISLEANPESMEAERLREYRRAGVNRLSVGVQSFQDPVLRKLGRRHSGQQAEQAIRAAGAIYSNLSLDLIYGARRSTIESARQDAARAVALPVSHISVYALTLDDLAEEVPLVRLRKQGRLPLPSEAATCKQGRAVRGVLRRAGLRRYEISNFARPGRESIHNQLYWAGHSYLGLGVGAFGCRIDDATGIRYGNHRTPAAWFAALEAGDLPQAEEEALDLGTLRRERIMMGLRTARGLEERLFPGDKGEEIAALLSSGLLRRRGGRLVLTARGFDLHSAVAERLF